MRILLISTFVINSGVIRFDIIRFDFFKERSKMTPLSPPIIYINNMTATDFNRHHSAVDMQNITDFLLELDALKHVKRRNHITQHDSELMRVENSAEHSWHLAMACWAIAERFDLDVNHEQLLKMALVHDLGEIDAGDTFLYASSRSDAHIKERDGIKRLQGCQGNAIHDLSAIWEAQETGTSAEAQLLRVVDRLLPFLLNLNTNGKTWIELGIKRSQVITAHAFIKDSFPMVHAWLVLQIEYATEQGWLIDG